MIEEYNTFTASFHHDLASVSKTTITQAHVHMACTLRPWMAKNPSPCGISVFYHHEICCNFFLLYDTMSIMKSIRMIFFFLVLAISLIIVLLSNQSPPETGPSPSLKPSFFIASYGKGKLYKDAAREISYHNLEAAFSQDKAIVFTGRDSSAAFHFSGHRLLLLENSGIEINLKINRFMLIEGSMVWKRLLKKNTEILIGSADLAFTLSDSGLLATRENETYISNYFSLGSISTPDAKHQVDALTHYFFSSNTLKESVSIPAGISDIDPLVGAISIKEPKDGLVRFNWKTIPGISEYRFRLFGSEGMAPVLLERSINSDRLIVDLMQYKSTDHFFWDITPYSSNQNILGVPSKMGTVERSGRIMGNTSALLPPSLEIKALTVSGSMVLIEGIAQADSELYIDDLPVKKDDSGHFIHTIKYRKMGQKKILFRLISPAEIETVIERHVTIFVE